MGEAISFFEHLNPTSQANLAKLKQDVTKTSPPQKTEFEKGIEEHPFSPGKKIEGTEEKVTLPKKASKIKTRDVIRQMWTGKYNPYEEDRRQRREYTDKGFRPKRHSKGDPGRDSSAVSYTKGIDEKRSADKKYVEKQIAEGKKDYMDQKLGESPVEAPSSPIDADWKKYRKQGHPSSESSLRSPGVLPSWAKKEAKQASKLRHFGSRGKTPVF